MRTLLFVLAALSAVGLADASQVIVLGNEPEEARPAEEPDRFVVVDPVCAFDGSGCMLPVAPGSEPLVGTPPQAAEPAPAQAATQSGEEPRPAAQSGEEPSPATAQGQEGP